LDEETPTKKSSKGAKGLNPKNSYLTENPLVRTLLKEKIQSLRYDLNSIKNSLRAEQERKLQNTAAPLIIKKSKKRSRLVNLDETTSICINNLERTWKKSKFTEDNVTEKYVVSLSDEEPSLESQSPVYLSMLERSLKKFQNIKDGIPVLCSSPVNAKPSLKRKREASSDEDGASPDDLCGICFKKLRPTNVNYEFTHSYSSPLKTPRPVLVRKALKMDKRNTQAKQA